MAWARTELRAQATSGHRPAGSRGTQDRETGWRERPVTWGGV